MASAEELDANSVKDVWSAWDTFRMAINLLEREVALSRAARVEQSMWAMHLLMQDDPCGRLGCDVPGRIDFDVFDDELALGELSRRVSRGDARERLFAVTALRWLADRRAISPLIRALSDPDTAIRLIAVDALSDLAPVPDWALPPLADRLADGHASVRAAAAAAVASSPRDGSAAALSRLLTDSSPAVRLAAAQGLSEVGSLGFFDPGAVGTLEVILACESDPFVVVAAYWALGWIPTPSSLRERFRGTSRGEWAWRATTSVAGTSASIPARTPSGEAA